MISEGLSQIFEFIAKWILREDEVVRMALRTDMLFDLEPVNGISVYDFFCIFDVVAFLGMRSLLIYQDWTEIRVTCNLLFLKFLLNPLSECLCLL